MIDIHTHLLPGLDDGAREIYDTIEMAAMAYESGTTAIIATPHCNIPGIYDNYFGETYKETFRYAKAVLEQEKIPIRLMPGMEAFAAPNLPKLLQEKRIMTLNGTRYLLVEFDFEEDPGYADRMLQELVEIRAVPVVAHAERYRFIQEHPGKVREWKQKGVRIQVNKGSFVGRFGRRAEKAAYYLLDHGLITAVASDAHSTVTRTAGMGDVYGELLETYSRSYLDLLFRINPQHICQGKSTLYYKRTPFGNGKY